MKSRITKKNYENTLAVTAQNDAIQKCWKIIQDHFPTSLQQIDIIRDIFVWLQYVDNYIDVNIDEFSEVKQFLIDNKLLENHYSVKFNMPGLQEALKNDLSLPHEIQEHIFSFLKRKNSLKLSSKNLYRIFHYKYTLEKNLKEKILYIVTDKILELGEKSLDILAASLNDLTQPSDKYQAFHSLYHALEYIAWKGQEEEKNKNGENTGRIYLPCPALWLVEYKHEVEALTFSTLRLDNKKNPSPDYLWFVKNQRQSLVEKVELPLNSFRPIIGVSISLQADFGHYIVSQSVNMRDYKLPKLSIQSSPPAIQGDKQILSNTHSSLLWHQRVKLIIEQAGEIISNKDTPPSPHKRGNCNIL